jgi:ParB-like chromosome segregation protein Spo0J
VTEEEKRAAYTNARALIMLHPDDCDPPHAADDAKMRVFVEKFEKAGFDPEHPAVIGYPFNGRIQLLSGSHRHAAAKRLGLKLPVTLWLSSDVEKAWGDLEEWAKIMRQVPVLGFDVNLEKP